MTAKRKPYNTYTKEFKLEAIRLMDESDCPASEVAMRLGIRRISHRDGCCDSFFRLKNQKNINFET